MPTLIATSGPLVDQRFEIAADLVLGREGADLIVPDDELSRRHAVLRPDDRGALIEDLGSTNGTWVDETRIEGAVRLAGGETIRLGQTTFTLEADPEPEPPAVDEGATRLSARPTGAKLDEAATRLSARPPEPELDDAATRLRDRPPEPVADIDATRVRDSPPEPVADPEATRLRDQPPPPVADPNATRLRDRPEEAVADPAATRVRPSPAQPSPGTAVSEQAAGDAPVPWVRAHVPLVALAAGIVLGVVIALLLS